MPTRYITDKGLQELTKLHAGVKPSKPFSHLAVGRGSAEPSAKDAGLQDELRTIEGEFKRKEAEVFHAAEKTGDPTLTTNLFVAKWLPGDIVSGSDEYVVREIGLFNGNKPEDVMYYREVRGALTISGTVGLEVRLKCKFSRVV